MKISLSNKFLILSIFSKYRFIIKKKVVIYTASIDAVMVILRINKSKTVGSNYGLRSAESQY